ncbi:L-threonylcarbamoyladenylate synthase [Cerasicoccus arenae]|uniref:Threonylcarbamoyl-AMP synthase n=1 Tax=Cerasicoccus arenae TaxID=424488 RepID=A0A8J3DG40_9BACT|nr:L-threonylcarbamoyladenylate synthase [Cerasicoccus arenae]MBK1857982.1 threonylcarbamoyl-AMP synthase [Cerasicoccus arenae]GHB97674.1 threonylcarbamoyl-AMP synthase [Cerasicoccus arenae]
MDALPSKPFLTGDEAGIAEAAAHLQAGKCVAAPTETVYGLAADAFNEAAVRDIFAIKSRPFIDPLIIHIHGLEQLAKLTSTTTEQDATIQLLAEAFWPGPLTLVLPKRTEVLDLVTANQSSVAVRCPAHPVMRKLLQVSNLFLAAPSANPFGYISPTTAQHVRDSLGDRCPYILDGGPCEQGLESTIVDLRNPATPVLLRPGPISRSELEQVLGRSAPSPIAKPDPTLAPGQLERHYSPRTRLTLHAVGKLPPPLKQEAQIFLQRPSGEIEDSQYWLSEDGNLKEAAHNLFALLHTLDDQPEIVDIHCEMPDTATGVADAIRDRLIRASKR